MVSRGSRDYKYVADPKTGKSVEESVLIMEKKLGRKLKPNEQVDHIDPNKRDKDGRHDNSPSNLRVISKTKNESAGGKLGRARQLKKGKTK